MSRRPLRRWLALASIGAATAIAYAPSFAVPFQFDDYARLLNNQSMQGADGQGPWRPGLAWLGSARIVPSLTFMLSYRLGGHDPIGYHVVNFAVHLLATLGVFSLALALCRTPRLRAAWPPERALLVATAAALLFACHPLQTQAVTYIIQRFASMAALFYVWSAVCYLRARTRGAGLEPGRPAPYFVASFVLAVCAILSKENAVTLPAAWLLCEWVGFGWPRGRRLAVAAGIALVFVAVPMAVKIAFWAPLIFGWWAEAIPLSARLTDAVMGPWTLSPGVTRPSPFEYLLTQATVVPRYLRLVVLPWGLNVDHDVPTAHALSLPVVAGVLFLTALVALGVSQVRRRPLAAFAILWVFITLSVESSVIPIVDVMVEHRMYLPMAGLAVGVGWLFAAAVERAPRAAWSAGAVAAAALIALTFARNVIWLSPVTLWVDAAEKAPDKARTQLNAGVAYHQAGMLDEAVAHYCRALKLSPDDPLAHDNLEIALEAQGKFDDVNLQVVIPAGDGVIAQVDAPRALISYCP